ncbi:hypothetical protein ACWEP8_38300 [Streptomyces hydrogenans]
MAKALAQVRMVPFPWLTLMPGGWAGAAPLRVGPYRCGIRSP